MVKDDASYYRFQVRLTSLFKVQCFSKIQKFSKNRDWPAGSESLSRQARLKQHCLRVKLILLQLLQSKTEQIEFRSGKEITSKINEKQKLTLVTTNWWDLFSVV